MRTVKIYLTSGVRVWIDDVTNINASNDGSRLNVNHALGTTTFVLRNVTYYEDDYNARSSD